MSSRTALKVFFQTGKIPKQSQMEDLIDSLAHLADDDVQLENNSTVSTTDATVTTLATIATANDTAYQVEAHVVAAQTTDYSEMAGYKLIATFRNDGGTLTQVGSTTVDHSAEDTAGWNATFDVSGTNIRVRVTGAAATNIDWKCSLKTTTVS